MPSDKKQRKKKDAPPGQAACEAPSTLPKCRQPSMPKMELSPLSKMPAGFDKDDFLFSKLYKSVVVVGGQTINEVLQIIFRQRAGENISTYTLNKLITQIKLSKKKTNSVTNKIPSKLLEEKLLAIKIDVTGGIFLLQKVFYDEYKKLSSHCQTQIQTFRELRNSLSHNYPLTHQDFEPHHEKLKYLLEKNEDIGILQNEIQELVEKKKTNADKELDQIEKYIDEKKKELYVIIEIEKLKIILKDILENVATEFKEDLTQCKDKIDKSLTDISQAKVEQYDQNTYNSEVQRYKDDPVHELITKAREELREQYRRLRVANPCPWMVTDQAENSSLDNFYIDRIYTPLKIEGPGTEVFTEKLLVAGNDLGEETAMSSALVVSGLAGSGKSSLCLYLLHHWAEGTDEIKTLKDYNMVIFVEMRTIKSNSLEEYLKTQRMKKSTAGISSDDIVQRLNDLKLLFIVDGYDEAKKSSRQMVEEIFAKFPEQRILLTTRGEFCNEVKKSARRHHMAYLTIEICGFDESRIQEFTEKVFKVVRNYSYYAQNQACSVRACANFLDYVQGRAKILEKLLELPLTLALMIYMWIDCPAILNRVTTATSLYYELFCLYQKKLNDRLKDPCSDKTLESLMLLVGKKAWELLVQEESILSKQDEKEIEEECINKGCPKEELMSAFLVYECYDTDSECNYDYSFMHKTQMEYLSAYFLVEESENGSLYNAQEQFHGSGFHQVIIFVVGHFARKKIIEQNLKDIFVLLDNADIDSLDYNFWWRLLTESLKNEAFLKEICTNRLPCSEWKLSEKHVVSGLQLLITSPVYTVKNLIIEINDVDPYDVKDLLSIMETLKIKFKNRYTKNNPILTELFFWHHFQRKCNKPSDYFLRALYPWGHLTNFVGSVGEQKEGFEVLRYCFNVKNLRVRLDTCDAEVCLANSLKRIGKGIKNLRVMLALDPSECDADSLVCLPNNKFTGSLELTLPNMTDENKKWIVKVVEKLAGGTSYGCSRIMFEKSTLSVCTVLYLMMELRDMVHEKLTVESIHELTLQEQIELEKQMKSTHMEVNWID
ncbi:uncharacterized protein LOC123520559 isoform X2 [Portunus trituberculatus]|uniref:NACHT, LRR and PYD domains-containing protein 12 n=2 Tax=Portunus trituberculatus TaxID=210409 RepID=A0A5B7DL00_PORTR|nr:uncharacterized protein LOC123520559 isoform X2 [Portunus trituberculatus]XP_045138870.1 uncharacterized protein LOC123520559 isoform X2 [Portunus trituberculatus]XP_045138871.1 uncharacterized protein LOC123520559 isoform X2 [Portunus trituberculatus]XP_045138872.1 uncharacterized protein LOC123520559 isoform X2 [Portunus trituberculatus]MPC21616.1 NACHT, LRR and PYD domains-containing protein 12 [Portunus trituberculatus]